MGGDAPPQSLFPAVLQALETLTDAHSFLVIATQAVIDQLLPLVEQACLPEKRHTIAFHMVNETISMADKPLEAVRRKKGSSLVVGVRLLKKKHLSALVSCGNTGALVAATALALPMLPGIERPGLLAQLPTLKSDLVVLDVGGNVQSKARHLVQFARFGAAYQRVAKKIAKPKIGLLNIGSESKKGTQEIRQAHETLSLDAQTNSSLMQFVGNIEARDIFGGDIDVLVTDGFTGNVLLKAAEGVASFIFTALGQSVSGTESATVTSLLESVQRRFNYAEYPGAIVCGVDGVVLKAHGNSSSKALLQSIFEASKLVEQQTILSIKKIMKNA
jgi:glycerol-3-phosphate acyltransferase PlsX